MSPVIILLVGVAIVLCGILILRLHAVLALLFAALAVALLTPTDSLRAYSVDQMDKAKNKNNTWSQEQADAFVKSSAPKRVATGFGTTCGKIGIIIAMASIIGKCLLESGSADRIVRSTLALVGQARAAIAFVGSGFLLGIPVFFDTVFYLMIPLGKAMRLRTGKNYTLYILAIVAGGSMAHSLVPPTPGPLFVAEKLGVDLLTMIIAGTCVGLITSSTAFVFATWLDKRVEIPLRDSPDARLSDLEAQLQKDDSELPSLWLALLPIVLPVALIALGTGVNTYFKNTETPAEFLVSIKPFLATLGDKNIALILSALIAMYTVRSQHQKAGAKDKESMVPSALAGAGVIILITASGGAFGEAVRQCGIAEVIGKMDSANVAIMVLPIAFLITTLIRSAQGSATVAMMTAVGLLAPLAESENFQLHPVYLALAIGCGSKPIAWMADSGFWVICKMSGMTEGEALKTVTPLSIVMGITGLIATMIGALLWPMA